MAVCIGYYRKFRSKQSVKLTVITKIAGVNTDAARQIKPIGSVRATY